MYAIKHKIMAACGFENPCDIALIYSCDGENVADESGALYMLNITLQCEQLDTLHADNGQLPNGIGRYFEICD